MMQFFQRFITRSMSLMMLIFFASSIMMAQDHARDDAPAVDQTLIQAVPAFNIGTPIPLARGGNVLYDNGPLVNFPDSGAGGAHASALQNTTLGMNTLGFGHQISSNNRMADDFTVTDAGGWRIDSIYFFAYQTNGTTTSSITDVHLQIWDGRPGDAGSNVIFGDTVTNQMVATTWSGIYRVTLTTLTATSRPIHRQTVAVGVTLPPGTYWLDWNAAGTLASGPWAPPVTINGDSITGNGRQYTQTSGMWNDAFDSGTLTAQQGLPFIVMGEVQSAGSYTSRPNKAIPDNNPVGILDTIVLPAVNIGMIQVSVDTLLHTWVGDIRMRLTSPTGDTVALMNRPGAGGFGLNADNFFNTVLTDTAANPIEGITGTGPITGYFSPDSVLSAFIGAQPAGPWVLYVSDNAGGDLGTLVQWSLTVIEAPTPPAGWTAQTSGVTSVLYSVKAVTTATAWTCGNAQVVLRTTDAGATWTSVGGPGVLTGDLYAIDAIDDQTAIVTSTPSTTTFLYRTTDAGATWTEVYSQAGGFINAIKMFDANNGIAQGDPVGGTWTIVNTTDGGATWARIATEPAQAGSEAGAVNGLAVYGTSHIWFTPGSGSANVYRSTDAGATWASSTLPFTAFTAGLAFNDTQYGVAGGNGGQVARTTDGGATWTSVTVGGSGAVYGAAGNGIDFFITRGATVYRSMDRGATWAVSYAGGVGTPLWHISTVMNSSNVAAYTVSNTGGIAAFYGTLTGVETGRQDGIAESYALMQNYPNPFNPSTTIRYSLPEPSTVSLRIYNLLGQQVAELVNEVKDAGIFQSQWNGRNQYGQLVSSGVYFYRMEAHATNGGNVFVSDKKMLMLK